MLYLHKNSVLKGKSRQVFVYSDHLWHKRRWVYKIIKKFS